MTRQFDPDYGLGSIRPSRPHGPDVVRLGGMSRFVLGVLRETAEPVPTSYVAARFMTERGTDGQDRKLVEQITKRIVSTLRRQGLKGSVRSKPGPGRVLLWEVVR